MIRREGRIIIPGRRVPDEKANREIFDAVSFLPAGFDIRDDSIFEETNRRISGKFCRKVYETTNENISLGKI